MLSDPEVESAVLISSDEGASFEKYPINFNILSLLFHPTQENWILAYSHDNKVVSYWICSQLLPWNKKSKLSMKQYIYIYFQVILLWNEWLLHCSLIKTFLQTP